MYSERRHRCEGVEKRRVVSFYCYGYRVNMVDRVSRVSRVVWLGLVLGLGLVSVIGLGVVVTSSGVSTKLLYTSGPVSTGMGDRLRRTNHLSISSSHPG